MQTRGAKQPRVKKPGPENNLELGGTNSTHFTIKQLEMPVLTLKRERQEGE